MTSAEHGSGPRIAVIDYGAGNMVSITHALEAAGARVTRARRPRDLAGTQAVVVPGVGASGPAMAALARSGLESEIRRSIDDGGWYLGVCLGMQLLFERSDEDGAAGFGLMGGNVERIAAAPRLPHIGWNQVESRRPHALTDGVEDRSAFYFVHSFAPVPTDRGVIVAETEHGGRFASIVARDRLLGVQFHPERSGADGVGLLRAFVSLVAA